LGDEDVFEGKDKYSYSALCDTHEGKVYKINLDIFFRFLLINKEVINMMEIAVREKSAFREKKLGVV
jgi:hypothetical protein